MQRRLNFEYTNLHDTEDRYYDITVVSPSTWVVTLRDLTGTPYEGGYFHIQVDFPENYPFKVPTFKFLTKIYHPNVSTTNGYVCVGMLQEDQWSSSFTIKGCVTTIYTLLVDPEMDNPIETDIAAMYISDIKGFDETAKKWSKWYAQEKESPLK